MTQKIFLSFLLFFNLCARAQSVNLSTNLDGSEKAIGADLPTANGHTIPIFKVTNNKDNPVAANQIKGECSAVVDAQMQTTAPCRGLEIAIFDADKKEIDRIRTGTDGMFQFINLKAKKYTISVISDKYFLRDKGEVQPGGFYQITVVRK